MPDPTDPRTRPLPPKKPDEIDPPPLPLMMNPEDQGRLITWLGEAYGGGGGKISASVATTVLLVEILSALRSIDDKMGKLLERPTSDP